MCFFVYVYHEYEGYFRVNAMALVKITRQYLQKKKITRQCQYATIK